MNDRISIKNLSFYGYHGYFEEEKKLGQKFFIDADLYTDLSPAGKSDDLEKTVNYVKVYEIIKDIIVHRRFNLIEAAAESIATEILEDFPEVAKVTVRVRKPEAPVAAIFDYFEIEITRTREQ